MSKDKYKIGANRWLSDEQINELMPEALVADARVNVLDYNLDPVGEQDPQNRAVVVGGGISVSQLGGVFKEIYNQTARVSSQDGRQNPEKYIIPLNVDTGGTEYKSGNHWTLAVIQPNENGVYQDGVGYKEGVSVTYIDPLSKGESIASANIVNRQLSEHFNVTDFSNLSCGQQPDGWACGYITTQNAVSLAADSTGGSLVRKYSTNDTEQLYNNASETLARLAGQGQGNPQEAPAPEVKKTQQAGQIPQAPKKVRFKEPVEQIPQDLSQSIVDPVNISSKDSPNPQEAETPQSSQARTQEPKKRKKTASELREEIKVLGEGVKSLSELQYTVPVRECVDTATDILYSGANKPKGKQKGIIGRLDNVVEDLNLKDGGTLLYSLFSLVANAVGLLKDVAKATASNVTEYVDVNQNIKKDIKSLQESQKNLIKELTQTRLESFIESKDGTGDKDKAVLGELKPTDTPSVNFVQGKVAKKSNGFVDMVSTANSSSAPIRT